MRISGTPLSSRGLPWPGPYRVIGAVQQQFATIGVFGVFHGNPFLVFVTCGPCLQAVHLVGELSNTGIERLTFSVSMQ